MTKTVEISVLHCNYNYCSSFNRAL